MYSICKLHWVKPFYNLEKVMLQYLSLVFNDLKQFIRNAYPNSHSIRQMEVFNTCWIKHTSLQSIVVVYLINKHLKPVLNYLETLVRLHSMSAFTSVCIWKRINRTCYNVLYTGIEKQNSTLQMVWLYAKIVPLYHTLNKSCKLHKHICLF